MKNRYTKYVRRGVVWARLYEGQEDLSNVYIPPGVSPSKGDLIAIDPSDTVNQWLIPKSEHTDTLEPSRETRLIGR